MFYLLILYLQTSVICFHIMYHMVIYHRIICDETNGTERFNNLHKTTRVGNWKSQNSKLNLTLCTKLWLFCPESWQGFEDDLVIWLNVSDEDPGARETITQLSVTHSWNWRFQNWNWNWNWQNWSQSWLSSDHGALMPHDVEWGQN